jgi:hypothetical protein
MRRRGVGPGPARGGMMRRRRRTMRRRMRRRMMVAGAVVLAIGNSCTKLSTTEVQQVEQQTGKKAEDLSEEELDAAMETLGIEGQEPTEQEVSQLEAEEDKNPSV